MTNEQIVERIRGGLSVTDDMERLYRDNLPLIKKLIAPYTSFEPEEDLLQEAYLGLHEAVERYDPSRGVLFMTYAGHWIGQRVRCYIKECGHLVRLPGRYWQEIDRYRKSVQAFQQLYYRTPTDRDMADFMEVPLKEIQKIRYLAQDVESIDAPIDEDGDICLSDTLQSDVDLENSTIDKMYEGYRETELWGIVERYTNSREAEVIRQHFREGRSLADIARASGRSSNVVWMHKRDGLQKLRTGRACREIREKLEVLEGSLYRTGKGQFRNHGDTSTVEHLAIRRIELKEGYRKAMGG